MEDNELLMMKRQNTGYMDGKWSVPAGHVEDHEKPTTAMIRETEEEIGIKIEPEDLKFALVNHRRAEEGSHDRVDYYFHCTRYSGTVKNREPEKCAELSWFPLDELPNETIPTVAHAVAIFRRQQQFSDQEV